MSSSASSSATKPALTRTWSSASITRIMTSSPSAGSWCFLLQRQAGPHPEAAARPRGRVKGAAEGVGPFGHADDAVARSARAGSRAAVHPRLPDPPAGSAAGAGTTLPRPVIIHFDHQVVRPVNDAHHGTRSFRMPGAVGERFLDDPVGGKVGTGRERPAIAVGLDPDAEPSGPRVRQQVV